MTRALLPLAAALAACTPSPQETDAMRSPPPVPGPVAESPAAPAAAGEGAPGAAARAPAMGPVPAPVSAAQNPAPARSGPRDSPAEAEGRRTLSTAFVRVGPDGLLTVTLRDGRELVLRNVALGPEDYCGAQVAGGAAGARFCGGYADVAAARPGGAPPPAQPDLAAPNPLPRP